MAIIDADGSIMATTATDPRRAERFVAGIARLVEQADALREARGLSDLAQLEAATLDGSVFVVRRNGRTIAATKTAAIRMRLAISPLPLCAIGAGDPIAGAQLVAVAFEGLMLHSIAGHARIDHARVIDEVVGVAVGGV